MLNKNLRSFKDQALNVKCAYEHTRLQYDDFPSVFQAEPIFDAINKWALICGCYMGIEQTMKLLIRMRIDTLEPESAEKHDLETRYNDKKLDNSHDLVKLYKEVRCSDREVVEEYYRVYGSLHEFDSGDPETASEFIEYIGKGYVAWRYILTENPPIPKIHVGAMLETWCALADLVQHRALGVDYPCQNVASRLAKYIYDCVFYEAGMDQEWEEKASHKMGISEWVKRKGGPLEAGIYLFYHHEAGTENFIEDSPLMSRVLLRAAANAENKIQAKNSALKNHMPTPGWADIKVFRYRVGKGDLAWNANARAFESRHRRSPATPKCLLTSGR